MLREGCSLLNPQGVGIVGQQTNGVDGGHGLSGERRLMSGRELSVIVPVFNEVLNVGPLVTALEEALEGMDWEVIFVDDNSPDGTAQKIHEIAQQDPRVRLIVRVADRGLAKSAIQGMLSGNGDVLVVMDGDGQHGPEIIHRLLRPILEGTADVSTASRILEDEAISASLSRRRINLSKFGNLLCRLVLRRRLSDPLTGFFAIDRKRFMQLADKLGDPGFKILLDVLSTDKTLRVQEVPFEFGSRSQGKSKLDLFVAWQLLMFLASRMTAGLIPARFISFAAVGLSGVAVHLILLMLLLSTTMAFPVAQALSATGAASSNFAFNNLLTFRDQRLKGWAIIPGLVKFLLVSSAGLFANVAMATWTLNHFTDYVILAALVGIAMDTVWKYVIASRLVW